jgi:hypothetical protein
VLPSVGVGDLLGQVDIDRYKCSQVHGRIWKTHVLQVCGEIAQWFSTGIPEIGGTIYQETLVIPIFESKKNLVSRCFLQHLQL